MRPTNVVKLARWVMPQAPDGTVQRGQLVVGNNAKYGSRLLPWGRSPAPRLFSEFWWVSY